MAKSWPSRLGRWSAAAALLAVAGISGYNSPAPAEEVEITVSDLIEADFGGRRLIRRGDVAKRGYGPEQAEGEPDTPEAGDRSSAWASQGADSQPEWLTCRYKDAVNAQAVHVHENYSPGALVKVTAFTEEGDEVIAWEGQDPTPRDKPRGVSVIPIRLPFPVQKIKLYIDSQAVPSWNEVDAVGLEDMDGNMQWAMKVEASSTYASPRSSNPEGKFAYSPSQATGAPDTMRPGDQSTAWASATADGSDEWMIAEFEKADTPAEIVVHENTAPGAITKVTVFTAENKEVTIFEGVDPTPRDQPWGVSVFPVDVDFAFKKIKIYIASRSVPGYNEVDAIGLRAVNGDTQWAKTATASTTYGVATPAPDPDEAMVMPAPEVDSSDSRKVIEELKKLEALRKELEALKEELKQLKP